MNSKSIITQAMDLSQWKTFLNKHYLLLSPKKTCVPCYISAIDPLVLIICIQCILLEYMVQGVNVQVIISGWKESSAVHSNPSPWNKTKK